MVLERIGNDTAAENQYLQALEFDSSWDMPGNRLLIVRQRMAEEAAKKE